MEVLFHFIFELIKISILASIYATLVIITIKLIGHFKPSSWFTRVLKNGRRLWINSGLIVSIGLFIYMFTYFGDHGLGDSSKVPVGHFKVVKYGSYSYLQNNSGEQVGISNFTFDSHRLYAQVHDWYGKQNGKFIIWDLQTDEWTFFKTEENYIEETQNRGYPLPDKFEDFGNHYSRYWNGWRFWLLP